MIEWILENKLDALAATAITIMGGSYVPWISAAKKIATTVFVKQPASVAVDPIAADVMQSQPSATDAHTAIHKLIDVIQTCRSHGDDVTADALSAMIPAVEMSCCKKKVV